MYINYLIICAILFICGYFLKFYNKLQIVDKNEKKISLKQLKFMKDLGLLFLVFGWIYLIFALIGIFLTNLNIDIFINLTPYLFLISILVLILLSFNKSEIFKSKRVLIIICAVLFIVFSVNTITTYILMPSEINVNNTSLAIKGFYGIDINLADIDKVEFADNIFLVKKLSGIKTRKSIKGRFIEENLGEVTVFLQDENNVVEVFLKNRKILCINFGDKNKTELFYGILKLKIKK